MTLFFYVTQWIEGWIYSHLYLCESCGDSTDKGKMCETCIEERT
jgi:hypothetical protein